MKWHTSSLMHFSLPGKALTSSPGAWQRDTTYSIPLLYCTIDFCAHVPVFGWHSGRRSTARMVLITSHRCFSRYHHPVPHNRQAQQQLFRTQQLHRTTIKRTHLYFCDITGPVLPLLSPCFLMLCPASDTDYCTAYCQTSLRLGKKSTSEQTPAIKKGST